MPIVKGDRTIKTGDNKPVEWTLYDDDGETLINGGQGLGTPGDNVFMRLQYIDTPGTVKKFSIVGGSIEIDGIGDNGIIRLLPTWGATADDIANLTDADSGKFDVRVGFEFEPTDLDPPEDINENLPMAVPGDEYFTVTIIPRIPDP